MPELPDLEMFSKNLRKIVLHKKVVSADIHNSMKVNITKEECHSILNHVQMEDCYRIGKELCFVLDNQNVFLVHLMLKGKFTICSSEESIGIQHKILTIDFEDNTCLAISDFKNMCKVTFNPAPQTVPDALGDSFSLEYFLGAVNKGKRQNIKALLINQHVIKGIGNAYADEILYDARISPESVAGKIPREKLEILYRSIISVLKEAIIEIEKIAPDIISGEERRFLKVHNSKLRYTETGERIIVRTVVSKITYFTNEQVKYI